MKFKVDSKELVVALAIVGKVSPTVPQGTPGYLVTVNADGSGFIYSRGDAAVVRAPLVVTDVEGEGDFLFPAKVVSVFRHIKGVLVFEVETDTIEGKTKVKYYRENDPATGVSGERLMESPKLVAKCEAEMAEAQTTHEYSPAVLRVALAAVKSYAAPKDSDVGGAEMGHFHTIQIFDDSKPEWAKGDGVMYAADSYRAAYFECATFKGKHFPLGVEHVPVVLSFLGDCEGVVKLHNAANMVFIEDTKGCVLGLRHRVLTHPRYAFYSLDKDRFVFNVGREAMLDALRQIQAEMADSQDLKKIRVVYEADKNSIVFQKADSVGSARSDLVTVTRAKTDPGNTDSFTAHVNIDHIIELFDNMESNQVELRVALIPKGNKQFAVFRTLDRVWYGANGKPVTDTTEEGAVECLVTRFMPSME